MPNSLDFLYPAFILLAFCAVAFGILRAHRRELARLKDNFGKVPTGSAPDMESVRGYFDAVREENAPQVDDITWNDLEMDAVYGRIDACCTSVGEEYLYAMLRRPSFDSVRLREREAIIAWLEREPDTRFAIQRVLLNLGKQKANGLPTLMGHTGRSGGVSFARICRVLAALPVLSAALFFVNASAAAAAMLIFAAVNCLVYIYQKSRMDAKFVTLRYFTALLSCVKTLSSKRFKGLSQAEILKKNYAPFARVAGMMASTYFTQRAGGELQPVADLIKMIVLYDVVRYDRAMEAIEKYNAEFRALYDAVGELDACISILSFRLSLPGYCLPEFHAPNAVIFEEIYHPLLENPVKNSGAIARGGIVTGSNASGKSTFIKALAVNGIFAQSLNTCCAKRFAMKPALVLTSMALRDSIQNGESYFVAEIKSVRRILEMLGRVNCLCFMDEILRGTNTPERIAASAAVLRHIARTKTLCVVASHDIELTELLKDEYDCFSFSERIEENGVTFDYKLHDGAAKTRNAIRLLGLMGVDKTIVEEAERMLARAEETE